MTVSVVEPETVVDWLVVISALISVVPVVVPAVTRPFEPVVSLTVATPAGDVVQVAYVVKSCVMVVVPPDDNNAVALNWCVVFLAMNGAFGVMVMEIGSTTVSVAVPEMLLTVSVALIVATVVPVTEVARPYEPKLLPIVTSAFEVVQAAAVVQSIIVPSENIAIAVNCLFVPVAMVGPAGDTVIEVSVPPALPQLMKPIATAKSAAMIILPYFRIFIILFSLA